MSTSQSALLQQISGIGDLTSAHAWLRARIQSLRYPSHPNREIYLIEHGLPSSLLLDSICGWLSSELKRHPLTHTNIWNSRHYPLLVLMTEFGYRYGGSGRELWPPLEARLSYQFSNDERAQVRIFFQDLQKHTLVVPPDSAWAAHFSIIAWPITHAVLPLELHVPLLQATLSLRQHVTASTPAALLVPPLQEWARRKKLGRLENLLCRTELAADLVRGLLCSGYKPRTIDPVLLGRIIADLRAAQHALRTLREVQRRQSQLRGLSSPARSSSSQSSAAGPSQKHWAPLVLRAEGSEHQLYVRPPPLPPELEAAARRIARELRPRMLGGRRAIQGRQLLGRQELRVRGQSLPEQDPLVPGQPLLEPTSLADISDPQVRMHLSMMEVDLRQPIIFEARLSDPDVREQRRRRDYTAQDIFWILTSTSPESLVQGMTRHGTVCKLECWRVELSQAPARQWLESVGIAQVPSPHIEILSSPSLSGPGRGPVELIPGDRFVLCIRDHGVGAVGPEDIDRYLSPGRWMLDLPAEPGEYELVLQAEGGAREPLSVQQYVPPEPPELVSLHLRGPSLSVEALRRGKLLLQLESDLPLEDLQVSLSLWSNKRVLGRAYSDPLPTLPCTLPAAAACWRQLFEAAEQSEPDLWQRALILRAEVGAIAERQWWLEPELAHVWWRPSAAQGAGGLVAESESSELGPVSICTRLASQPLAVHDGQVSHAAVVLWQPLDKDGKMLLGSGVCRAPSTLSLEAVQPARPRLLRRAASSGQGVGAADLVEGYLAWETASGRGLIAESARRRVAEQLDSWMAEILCGQGWRELEVRLLHTAPASIGAVLARELWASRLGKQLAERLRHSVSRDIEAVLQQELAARLDNGLPDLDAEAVEDASAEELSDRLRELVAETYMALSRSLPSDNDEMKPATLETHWSRGDAVSVLVVAMKRYLERVELRALLELIYPVRHAESLAGLPLTDHDELSAWLADWLSNRWGSVSRWEAEDVGELLLLWTDPGRVRYRTPKLKEVLEAALIDRSAARAIRYAGLRAREHRRGEL